MDGITRTHREKSAVFAVFSLVCTMLFSGSLAFAQVQTGHIEGHVVDAQNLPMPGTNIVLKGAKLGAVASTEGTFVLRQVPAGSYTLVATFVGYDRVERKVRVEAGQVTQLAITMEQRPIDLDAVVVFGVDKVQEVQSRREKWTPSFGQPGSGVKVDSMRFVRLPFAACIPPSEFCHGGGSSEVFPRCST